MNTEKPHPIHGYSNVRNGQLKTQGQIEVEKLNDVDENKAVEDLVNPPKKSGLFSGLKKLFK